MNDPGLAASHRLSQALGERYRIDREIGRGGMATVYLADDLRHHRQVAIKVLHPELGAWLGAERFLSEIRITARLQHPHILPLLDSGEVPASGHPGQSDASSLLYYVMPYVVGETLRTRLERERQLGVEDAVRIAKEVAGALAYAHARSVIHRDIKPENILLAKPDAGGQQTVLLSDFGIARSLDAAGDRLTGSGITVGTAAYMSPEQATAEREIDGRTDIYSLGCVLYEMLAGEPPFTGPNPRAILSKQLADPVRPVRRIRDAVPPHIDSALSVALGRSPADRFPDVAAFAAALDGSNRSATVGADASRNDGSSAPARWRRSRLAAGGLAALAMGAAAWAWSRPTPEFGMPSVRIQRFTTAAADTASAYLAATLQQDVVVGLASSRAARVFMMDSSRLPSGFAIAGVAARLADSVEIKITVVRDSSGEFIGTRTVRRPIGRVHELPELATDAILELVRSPRAKPMAQAKAPTRDSLAYDLFLKGRYQTDRRTELATQRAVALLQAAVKRDSTFAEGWAGLARALHQAGLRRYRIPGIRPDSISTMVLDASQRALDADSTSSYVWLARGIALREIEPTSRRDMIAAMSKAIALDSTNADAWHYIGVAWEDSLEPGRALDAWRQAVRIDPTHRQALGFLSLHYMWQRQYDSALAWGDSGKRVDPAHVLIRQGMGLTRLLRNDLSGAADEFQAEIRLSQGPDEGYGWAGLADLASRRGDRAGADTLLARAIAIVDTLHPTPHEAAYLAWAYVAVGQQDRAIRLLQRFEPRGDVHYQLHLQRDPVLDPLRSMPAFKALLVRQDPKAIR